MDRIVIANSKIEGPQVFDKPVHFTYCTVMAPSLEAPSVQFEYCSGNIQSLKSPDIRIDHSYFTGSEVSGNRLELFRSAILFQKAELSTTFVSFSSDPDVSEIRSFLCVISYGSVTARRIITDYLNAYRTFLRCDVVARDARIQEAFILRESEHAYPVAAATDYRGYVFTATARPWTPKVRAGCRDYSYEEALRHWADTPNEELVKGLIEQACQASDNYTLKVRSWGQALDRICQAYTEAKTLAAGSNA